MIALVLFLGPALAADQGTELAQAGPPAPKRFVPTEKIKADTVIDFPVDI